jgi:DNA-binding beta-propeller fold protein YncE
MQGTTCQTTNPQKAKCADANFPGGSTGLIAVDKIGNKILFLDPQTYATTLTLDAFAPRVHELAISPDHKTAYVPIYGDGVHGHNPHPGHLIAVIDLVARRHAGDFSTDPYLAPHGLRWGPTGQLYCTCENSGVVLEMNAETGSIEHVIEVGSDKAHRIEVTPDGAKLYTENEEDTFACVIDLKARKRIKKIPVPNGLAGIGMSPDGTTIVLVDAKQPRILIIDTASDEVVRTVPLEGHDTAAQIARYSPDGKYLIVTSHDAPLATIFDAKLETQKLLRLGQGPMDMTFHPDGRTLLIANQDAGSLAEIDMEQGDVRRTVKAGDGIENLSFY